MDLRCQILQLCWELLLSILCMLCMDKGISLNLNIMIFGNHVVIMIMSIYVYMHACLYVCMSLIDRIVMDLDGFMLMVYMYICMHVCMYVFISLYDMVSRIMLVE